MNAQELLDRGDVAAANPAVAKRSALESEVITKFIRSLGLTHYIDVGCWYGFLLRNVLARCSPERVIAVEAVPEFAEYARRSLEDPSRVEFRRAVLAPYGRAEHPFRIHDQDTSKSGLGATEGEIMNDAEPVSLLSVLGDLTKEEIAASYLKLDLEGIDEQVVAEILESGWRPGAIEFEIIGRDYRDGGTVGRLEAAGYKVPRLDGTHPYWSVTCSASRCAVVGFKPDTVYWH